VEGSLRSYNGNVRLTVQVNRAADGYHIVSQTWDGSLKDLNRIEGEIVQPVVSALRPGRPAPPRRTPAPEAYDLMLKAKMRRLAGNKAAFEEAVEYLKRAVEIDPQYSDAWGALAGVYAAGALNRGGSPLSYAGNAEQAAQRALELDPS